ncbi:hypothetical protein ACFWA4_05820 [Streptomyces sp. NPDC060011]|uniref:hypothetical protein n=1 Tax=Streptomyces sp. NPDC060011 TaxID=3347037 RepID=UPI0036836C2E
MSEDDDSKDDLSEGGGGRYYTGTSYGMWANLVDAASGSAVLGSSSTSYTALQEKADRSPTLFAAGSVTLGIAGLGTMLITTATDHKGDVTKAVWVAAIGFAVTCLILLAVTVPWLITRRTYMKNKNVSFDESLRAQKKYEREVMEKLKLSTQLTTLMGLNQGQITRYHNIVTEQADKSFKSSRLAMGVGLFLLVCAAFGGVYVPLEEIRWFIGALAAFSTLLSGYLTKTYLAMYKESIGQLNRYFDQPVLHSYYLTAERLTEGLDVEHAQEVRQQIINEVLATSSRMGSRPAQPKDVKTKSVPKKRRPKKQTSSMNGTPQT